MIKSLNLKRRNKENFNKSLIMKFPFSKNLTNLKEIIKKSYANCSQGINNSILKDNKISLINTMNVNLSSALIHNFNFNKFKIFNSDKCNMPNCNLCNYTYKINYILINKKFYMPILSNNNCQSVNAIYIIQCKLCKDTLYIGQTQEIKTRIRQHILDIKRFIPFVKKTCVSTHFNLVNHNFNENFNFFVVEDGLDDLDLRLKKEASLINLFKTLGANVLNDFIPNVYSLF